MAYERTITLNTQTGREVVDLFRHLVRQKGVAILLETIINGYLTMRIASSPWMMAGLKSSLLAHGLRAHKSDKQMNNLPEERVTDGCGLQVVCKCFSKQLVEFDNILLCKQVAA